MATYWSADYDTRGRILTETTTGRRKTHYIYQENTAQPITIINPIGGKNHFQWDERELLISVTDCSGSETQYRYNAQNLLAQVTLPTGEQVTYDYDPAGRLTKVTAPEGH